MNKNLIEFYSIGEIFLEKYVQFAYTEKNGSDWIK